MLGRRAGDYLYTKKLVNKLLDMSKEGLTSWNNILVETKRQPEKSFNRYILYTAADSLLFNRYIHDSKLNSLWPNCYVESQPRNIHANSPG